MWILPSKWTGVLTCKLVLRWLSDLQNSTLNHLLKEVEQGVQLSSGKKIGGMLFADDLVGISDSKESLQKLIDVVYGYCNKG